LRGDIIHEVYGVHRGRSEDVHFASFRTRESAQAHIAELESREMHGRSWAKAYHDQGFVIREVVVDTDFEIPTRPKPRDKYCVRATPFDREGGGWRCTKVDVLRRTDAIGGVAPVATYERNHSMYATFEPFRQGGRDYALISRDYTRTAVLDLATGEVVAEETAGSGFCPVGFYVPDWWDENDDSTLPGSKCWSSDSEWPDGSFGLVWGCIWGDDSSWKVQWLDLSDVAKGIVRREERFGYLELGTQGYHSPCLTLAPPPPEGSRPPPFVSFERYDDRRIVRFHVEMRVDLETGQPLDWKRTGNFNLD